MSRGAVSGHAAAVDPSGPSSPATGSWEPLPGLEDGEKIDPAELEEFMAADGIDVEADPVFRERLRHEPAQILWEDAALKIVVVIEDVELWRRLDDVDCDHNPFEPVADEVAVTVAQSIVPVAGGGSCSGMGAPPPLGM